jgi:hypothetical protein
VLALTRKKRERKEAVHFFNCTLQCVALPYPYRVVAVELLLLNIVEVAAVLMTVLLLPLMLLVVHVVERVVRVFEVQFLHSPVNLYYQRLGGDPFQFVTIVVVAYLGFD